MKGHLGSEVLLKVETLSKDNFATTDSHRAPDHTWSAMRGQPVALHRIRTWGIIRDGQGCHHLLPTPQPWKGTMISPVSPYPSVKPLVF